MNVLGVRFLFRRGSKDIRHISSSFRKMVSSEEPCPPPKPKPCPAEPISTCPQPPPCPPVPPCPPTMCPPNPDPNNPCNYCPPPCIDPDYPDLTKLKRLQCKFQEDNDIPVFLKGGTFDVFLFHTTVILTTVCTLMVFYNLYKVAAHKD